VPVLADITWAMEQLAPALIARMAHVVLMMEVALLKRLLRVPGIIKETARFVKVLIALMVERELPELAVSVQFAAYQLQQLALQPEEHIRVIIRSVILIHVMNLARVGLEHLMEAQEALGRDRILQRLMRVTIYPAPEKRVRRLPVKLLMKVTIR
jgi:hypothetical protein